MAAYVVNYVVTRTPILLSVIIDRSNCPLIRSLSLGSSFVRASEAAALDLTNDEDAGEQRRRRVVKQWDKKRKRFVGPADTGGRQGKIRTESGAWIPASYKSDAYSKWLKRNRGADTTIATEEREEDDRARGVQVLGTRRRGGGSKSQTCACDIHNGF